MLMMSKDRSHRPACILWNKDSHEHYSSSRSKTLRAAMGFSFHCPGCVKRSKDCRNERHAINGSPRAAKTKEKPAKVKQ
jgi:hypothetical protein